MKKSHFLFSFLLFLSFAGCCKDDNNPIPPSVSIHSADIAMGELLDLGQTVAFYYESTQEITQGVWTLEVPTESGETVVIFTHELAGIGFTVVTPPLNDRISDIGTMLGRTIDSFIPKRGDYKRTESGMLDARVRLTGTFANGALASGEYAVELPYRPSKPTLEVCRVEDDEYWTSKVTVKFSSFGVNSYSIGVIGTFSTMGRLYHAKGNETEKTFDEYMFLDIEYEISIQAYNQYGISEETKIYIGGDPYYYGDPSIWKIK